MEVEVSISTLSTQPLDRERVKDKKVIIEHISTELMIADPLTKGMPPFKFKHHVQRMGLGSTS